MRIAVPLAAAATVLALAGCRGTEGGDVTATPSSDARTDLTVVVRSAPGAHPRSYELTCDPPGGDHPDPEAACRLLDGMAHPFAPLRTDRACTEIYGGPQTARVTGTYRGRSVDAEFKRTDGCEISRWDAYADLLVERGGGRGT